MAEIINSVTYKYKGNGVRQVNAQTVANFNGIQTMNITTLDFQESLMDYWFFDYIAYHGANPKADPDLDTVRTTSIVVDGVTTTDIFNKWTALGSSPLYRNNATIKNNAMNTIIPKKVDFTVTVRPIIWKDIYGKVSDAITFNIIGLDYYRINPLYNNTLYPSYPDFVGNKYMIPNAKGFLEQYYANVLELTGCNYRNFTLGDEYAIDIDYPTLNLHVYESKRIRNPIYFTDYLFNMDALNSIYGTLYGVMPVSIVATAHE